MCCCLCLCECFRCVCEHFAHDNGIDDSNCTMRCGLSDCIPPIECHNELNNTITIIITHNTSSMDGTEEEGDRERETEGSIKIKWAGDFVTTKATHLSHFLHVHQSDRHKKYLYTHCTSVYCLWMSDFLWQWPLTVLILNSLWMLWFSNTQNASLSRFLIFLIGRTQNSFHKLEKNVRRR